MWCGMVIATREQFQNPTAAFGSENLRPVILTQVIKKIYNALKEIGSEIEFYDRVPRCLTLS